MDNPLLLSSLILFLAIATASADFPGDFPGLPYIPKPEIPLPFTIPNLVGEFLTFDYYSNRCPGFEAVINSRVNYWVDKDPSLAADLLQLHFVDCMIRGCDASILVNQEGSERSAPFSKNLRGFEVIDDIKAELEKKCPKTVTCADILSATARDAIHKIGGPYWEVGFGRKDGFVSKAAEINSLPKGYENVTYLIEFFQSRGLSLVDLVVLSGAHTIGKVPCGAIQDRLYNFKGTGRPDPSVDPRFLNYLRRKCRWSSDLVDLDPITPDTFDNVYYMNLLKNMGVLYTDQILASDSRTGPLVQALADQPMLFRMQFRVSMINLADTEVLTGDDEGEIRLNCNFVNP